MNAENLILKRSLVLQSFAPLFILLAIKHIKLDTFWHLMVSFIKLFSYKGLVAVSIAVKNENFGSFVIFIISLMWLLATLIDGFNKKIKENNEIVSDLKTKKGFRR